MTTKYIFDISKSEFKDDYSGGEKGELWQDYAKEQLLLNLKSILSDAKEYARFRNSEGDLRDSSDETWLSHNAILVTSQRGSGKTVFLRNSKSMWAESKNETSELFFLKVIDPTMLMANDSFANVIVAQIYDAVSKRLSKLTCCDDKSKRDRDTFHRYLKKLADSMGKTSEFNGSVGIDKILKYSSGIHLEANFHNFVESAIEILGCKAIAVLIDDVDMALDKAFEVVDDVRRFLGCPYIIPVVSGELKLFEHMTQNHFDEKAYDNKCDNHRLREAGQEMSEELTDAYLTKVFPAPMRISLFSVDRLLAQMTIVDQDKKHMSFYEYRESIFNQFYHLRHNAEARRNWPELSSAREFTQLVRTLRPEYLNQHNLTISGEIALYNRLKNWAIQKKSGEVLALAETVITLLQNTHKYFDITELLVFNIKAQIDANLYHWAEFEAIQSQEESLSFKSDSGNNLKTLKSVFKGDDRCLQSMPPLEFIYQGLFIAQYREDKESTIELSVDNLGSISSSWIYKKSLNGNGEMPNNYRIDTILKDIYTESKIYSTLNNERQFIFFSRAFELILLSFFQPKDDIAQVESIYQILSRKPFYSLIKLTETKVAVEGEAESNSNSKGTQADTTSTTSIALFSLIVEWQKEHAYLLHNSSKTQYIAVFSYAFNGVFTALNIIKGNLSSKHDDEYLTDMILRFKYNLLNAIVRAGIYGEAIQANVLVGAKTSTVRTITGTDTPERTYTRNYKKLDEQIKNAKLTNETELEAKLELVKNLHDAVSTHPVFSIFMDADSNVKTMMKVGSGGETEPLPLLLFRDAHDEELYQARVLREYIGSSYRSVAFFLQFLDPRVKNTDTIKRRLEAVFNEHTVPRLVIRRLSRLKLVIKDQEKNIFDNQNFHQIEPEKVRNLLIALSLLDISHD
ncbi:hypothetical protein [Pseudoalteromonas sp. S3431]|uniref:hypothetical protein n=1 Tax=Pseudoalteromonas sp. S3431 TaxID=579537 RepID=UPI00049F2911|nr:hypothetical protein [Pseudoalteromonas sp. S3431]KDC53048.1 hypothetical protein DO88_13945 [Pseudoalteromonas sp. S3431]